MSGAVPLLPLYVFMAWRGANLPVLPLNLLGKGAYRTKLTHVHV